MKHIIFASQFADRSFLDQVFRTAAAFQKNDTRSMDLKGKILAALFFEPSTRTRFSFESAMLRLGGQVMSAENASAHSSAGKGESLEDTIRIVGGYADCIVLRHPEIGAAKRAAQVSEVPIINAGDGSGEHPTQALLDVYTIQKEFGQVDSLSIAFVGDLLYGRTVHSLAQLLGLYKDIHITFVSPQRLAMPEEYKKALTSSFEETDQLQNILGDADVIYMTRIQKERFASEDEYQQLKNLYTFGENELVRLKKNAIIMHALPRLEEISSAVDKDPRAAYFRQAQNGLFVRMAILHTLLAK